MSNDNVVRPNAIVVNAGERTEDEIAASSCTVSLRPGADDGVVVTINVGGKCLETADSIVITINVGIKRSITGGGI
jgi:hypothetical protein